MRTVGSCADEALVRLCALSQEHRVQDRKRAHGIAVETLTSTFMAGGGGRGGGLFRVTNPTDGDKNFYQTEDVIMPIKPM